MRRAAAGVLIPLAIASPFAAAAHQLEPPIERQHGIALKIQAKIREAPQLLQTLSLESYDTRGRGIGAFEEPGNDVAELRRLAAALDRRLDDLVRYDETTELLNSAGDLKIVSHPSRLHLVAGVSRLVPVIARNSTARAMDVDWRIDVVQGAAAEEGSVRVAPRSTARFFVPVTVERPGERPELHFRTRSGRAATVPAVDLAPSGSVAVRVLDEQGEATPSRVIVTTADGKVYVPEGAVKRLGSTGEVYSFVPGGFVIRLPVGHARLEFVKGFEREVEVAELDVPPGRTIERVVRMKRIANLPESGWYSGDGHIHMSYGGPLEVEPADVLLMLRAEDVNVGNLMVANRWGDDVYDRERFEARPNSLSLPRHVLYWSEEFRNRSLLGHMVLYGLKELTDPLYSGFSGSASPYDFPPNADIADQVLEQGGFVTGAHPVWGGGEHAADVVLGKMGGIEAMGYGALWPVAERVLHGLWNCGFRVVATAGTDAFLNVVESKPLGGARSYAHVEGAFSYDSWVAAVQAGRTFITSGPLLTFDVDARGPGSELELSRRGDDAPARAHVRAKLRSRFPVSTLDILRNGEVVARVEAKGADVTELSFDGSVDVPESGWIAARGKGPPHRFVSTGLQVAASSPVWLVVDGEPMAPSSDAVRLVAWIDELLEAVETRGRYADAKQLEYVRRLYRKARSVAAGIAPR